MKTRFTGRKQNKRKRILLSSRHILKISSFPGHAPGKDTLRAANAATERGLTGENARANAVSGRALSPVLPKVGANGGENARASVLRSEGVCSPVYCCHAILITLTDISSPVAADSLHRLIIAPARAAAVFDSPVGGRLGLGSVGVMPSLVMTI